MEALKLAGEALFTSEVTERSVFQKLEAEWDALVARTNNQVFYRHAFVRVWLDNFAPTASWRILLARAEDGTLKAVLPLVCRRATLYGVPVRELASAANPHSCRFDLVAESPEEAGALFWSYLVREDDWDVLRVTDVPQGGAAESLFRAAQREGYPTGRWESLRSRFVPLPGEHEELLRSLDSKFKANVRRRRRKLEEKGTVRFERVTGGDALWARLEEGLALEQAGWKGARGTAINQDASTRGFYLELARNMAHQGRLSLYFLRLDGRAIAFQFGLEHEGKYLFLKPGYDEALRECSPGQLLMDEVLKDCIQRGLTEFDFLGPDMEWKRDWTNSVRVHNWLYAFRRSAKGRALAAAKFRWAPVAKEVVSRWKR